jgi:hypothetical protein
LRRLTVLLLLLPLEDQEPKPNLVLLFGRPKKQPPVL